MASSTGGVENQFSGIPASLQLLDGSQLAVSSNLLGMGAFGCVYSGSMQFQTGEQIEVAVKEINNPSLRGPLTQEEIRIYEELPEHPNIVKYYGCTREISGSQGSHIVLELVPDTLHDVVFVKKKLTTYRSVIDVLYGIVEGICHLHDNSVVHFDLKPTNILITADMEPKIADFGISKADVQSSISRKCRGTRKYMAPELLIANLPDVNKEFKRITNSVDIYSFGILALCCVTGQEGVKLEANDELIAQNKYVEIGHYRPQRIGCDCPPPLKSMIEKCLRFKVDAESVREFDRPSAWELKDLIANMFEEDWLDTPLPGRVVA